MQKLIVRAYVRKLIVRAFVRELIVRAYVRELIVRAHVRELIVRACMFESRVLKITTLTFFILVVKCLENRIKWSLHWTEILEMLILFCFFVLFF